MSKRSICEGMGWAGPGGAMGKDVRSQNPPTSSLVPPSCCSARGSEEPGSWDVEPTVGRCTLECLQYMCLFQVLLREVHTNMARKPPWLASGLLVLVQTSCLVWGCIVKVSSLTEVLLHMGLPTYFHAKGPSVCLLSHNSFFRY